MKNNIILVCVLCISLFVLAGCQSTETVVSETDETTEVVVTETETAIVTQQGAIQTVTVRDENSTMIFTVDTNQDTVAIDMNILMDADESEAYEFFGGVEFLYNFTCGMMQLAFFEAQLFEALEDTLELDEAEIEYSQEDLDVYELLQGKTMTELTLRFSDKDTGVQNALCRITGTEESDLVITT